MKVRKALQLKQLHMQKLQILDMIQACKGDPSGMFKKDLRNRKIKFRNTLNSYLKQGNWKWIFNKMIKENKTTTHFKPVYRESKEMQRLNTNEDEANISEVASFYRPITTQRSDYPLSSDRSASSNPFDRATTFTHTSFAPIPTSHRSTTLSQSRAQNPKPTTFKPRPNKNPPPSVPSYASPTISQQNKAF
jgi:hypothetical protein